MADANDVRRINTLIHTVIWGALLGAMLYLGLALWVGWRDLWRSFGRLGATAILLGIVASMIGYGMRFGRWQWLLRSIHARVPVRASLPIYMGGLALTATPGKIGETIRTLLLMRHGVPARASLAAFFVDRLSDLIGVLVLTAAVSLDWRWAFAAVLAASIGLVLHWLMRHPRTVARLHASHPHPRWRRIFLLMEEGRVQYLAAWTRSKVPAYVCVAVLAYGAQSMVFAVYARILWSSIDPASAVYIFSTATLVGAASLIPGGLGAMEATMIAMLIARGVPPLEATTAAIAIRTVTLWFGILLGVVNLMLIRKYM